MITTVTNLKDYLKYKKAIANAPIDLQEAFKKNGSLAKTSIPGVGMGAQGTKVRKVLDQILALGEEGLKAQIKESYGETPFSGIPSSTRIFADDEQQGRRNAPPRKYL